MERRIKRISILGSTGSIGQNVLRIAERFPDRFEIVGLSAGKNVGLLRMQIEAFRPRVVSVQEEESAVALRAGLPAGCRVEVVSGTDGAKAVATLPQADTVVSAMVGAAGLVPTHQAICAGKDIALANKEVLVMAGSLIMKKASEKGVAVLPIDSEHSAVFQSLLGHRKEDVRRIILTASGGPFLNLDSRDLTSVTPGQALKHPNWQMGKKISIDSATLMNKGLEVIEAKWLFDVPVDRIDVIVHPQSVIHSMVEYVDGSVIAQMGIPDMQGPIAYALSYPERLDIGLRHLSLSEIGRLTFSEPDMEKFPCLGLAYSACRKGGPSPVALNAANEAAVEAFLEGTIRFTDIARVVEETMSRFEDVPVQSLADVTAIDQLARIEAARILNPTGC